MIPAVSSGITPARAGKSGVYGIAEIHLRDHPRACGEKKIDDPRGKAVKGSPPRVRGKDDADIQLVADHGITPARAGKSGFWRYNYDPGKDHPRACGEKT